MALPVFRRLDGTANGTNKVFETPTSYLGGSVRIFRNGVVLDESLVDGWDEFGGKKVLLKEAPEITDILVAYYIPV